MREAALAKIIHQKILDQPYIVKDIRIHMGAENYAYDAKAPYFGQPFGGEQLLKNVEVGNADHQRAGGASTRWHSARFCYNLV